MVLKFHLIPGGFPEVSLMSFGNRSAMNGRCASGMTLPAVPLDLWKKRCHLMRRCVTRQFSSVCMNEPCLWSDSAHLLLVQRLVPEGGPYGRQRGAGLRSVTVPEGVDQASYRPLFSSRRHASWFPIVHTGDEKSISRHAPRGDRVGFVKPWMMDRHGPIFT